ncbi:agmatine deiminase [Secundilactobacillus kimchicus JCM 15530]|uniref:Putative agmatine deiminase n=1 Tax=Secundilactobacillus kimchicus JCM 15530 TaxID=1302272 RepID=A0A0R1HY40_9LACO|nr:agmatine deiminase [Secundilactobacillus kimchicus]KRK48346.1 agmatine deiminase [Secundilactobacillus kimchicus JCM 15530]
MIQESTPIQDGFRLPGEFEDFESGYMIWPQRPDNWRDGGKPAQKKFVQLAKLLSQYQAITVLVNENQYKNARGALPDEIRVIEMSSNDAFVKDTGPFYVVDANQQVRCVDFSFNAWGGLLDGLYFPWDKDDELGLKLADLDRFDSYQSDFVLEGCSVAVDGEGTLITTEDVILSEGRNGQITKTDAEQIFHDYLGITKVIWLKQGFFMDETGGDADNMVSFVEPGEILLTWTDDETDDQYGSSHEALRILENETDARGRKLKIHKVIGPKPQWLSQEEANGVDPINGMLPRNAGQRLTATYVNAILLNEAVVVPEFDDPQDEVAKQQFASFFPSREVVGFPAREFLTGGGGLHTLVLSVPTHHLGGDSR